MDGGVSARGRSLVGARVSTRVSARVCGVWMGF